MKMFAMTLPDFFDSRRSVVPGIDVYEDSHRAVGLGSATGILMFGRMLFCSVTCSRLVSCSFPFRHPADWIIVFWCPIEAINMYI